MSSVPACSACAACSSTSMTRHGRWLVPLRAGALSKPVALIVNVGAEVDHGRAGSESGVHDLAGLAGMRSTAPGHSKASG